MPRFRRIALLAAAVALFPFLAGCSSTVSLNAADESNDPLCAELTVRLPALVAGEDRRFTDAQATGAWGTPSKVLLTCGVEVPGPTTQQCVSAGGVDWIVDDTDAPRFRVTTYGRTPAVEVFIDTTLSEEGTGVTSRDVLDALSPLVAQYLPKDGECIPRDEATPVPEPVDP